MKKLLLPLCLVAIVSVFSAYAGTVHFHGEGTFQAWGNGTLSITAGSGLLTLDRFSGTLMIVGEANVNGRGLNFDRAAGDTTWYTGSEAHASIQGNDLDIFAVAEAVNVTGTGNALWVFLSGKGGEEHWHWQPVNGDWWINAPTIRVLDAPQKW